MSKPEGMSWIIPYITVTDVAKTRDFYQQAFDFEPIGEPMIGDDGVMLHAEMRHKDGVIMFGKAGIDANCKTLPPVASKVESPVALYIYVDDVDAVFARAKSAGAKVIGEPEDMFWGDRMCRLQDFDEHSWNFATHLG